MDYKEVKTFEIRIYVGLREEYSEVYHDFKEVEEICQKYCDDNGFCVSVTKTKFIYTEGNEPGVIVGIINYPRFPSTPKKLTQHAITLGTLLLEKLGQIRVSISTTNNTIMLTSERKEDGQKR